MKKYIIIILLFTILFPQELIDEYTDGLNDS